MDDNEKWNEFQLKLASIDSGVKVLQRDFEKLEDSMVLRIEHEQLRSDVKDLKDDRKKLWWAIISGLLSAVGAVILANADKLQ